MDFLKGKLALRVFERFPQLGRRYWRRHLWSRPYCVSWVPPGRGDSGIDEEMIRQYVRWQEQQDRQLEDKQEKLIDG